MPQEVVFQTKPELAWTMLAHAWRLGMPGRWVTADTVYGQDPRLRARLDGVAPTCHYVLAVPATTPAWIERPPAPATSRGSVRVTRTWTAHTAASVTEEVTPAGWQRIVVAAGSKGPPALRVGGGARGGRPSGLAWSRALVADPPLGQ